MLYTQVGGTIFIIATSALFIFGLELGLFSLLLAATLDEALRSIVNTVNLPCTEQTNPPSGRKHKTTLINHDTNVYRLSWFVLARFPLSSVT